MSGKWKLPIIGSLMFGKKRFRELERDIPKITPRMLSKELKDLELNGMVSRTVYDTIPVTVEYELTKSGFTLSEVLDKMMEWGVAPVSYTHLRAHETVLDLVCRLLLETKKKHKKKQKYTRVVSSHNQRVDSPSTRDVTEQTTE